MNKLINWIKTKKPWKLLLINLLIIISGASIIVNATYLPKYFNLKNQDEGIVSVNIAVIDDQNHKLFNIQYHSSLKNLGDLMALESKNYDLTSGKYGRMLIGITYYDDLGNKKYLGKDPNKYWEVDYNNKAAQVGIDLLNLHMNDTFQLKYTKIEW